MSRLGALFWLLLVVSAGFVTFKVKYDVQDIEEQLNRVRKETIAEQQEIRVLTAEWTYLNQPERLADLNRRFLSLVPIAAKQLQRRIDDIPLRPSATADLLAALMPQAAPAALPPAPLPKLAVAAPQPAPLPPAPPVRAASFGPTRARPPLRYATASPGETRAAGSLNALFAQIAERR
ncbi:MAG: hypothetical protein ACM3JG_14930 [Thiohalocapsa sp.]